MYWRLLSSDPASTRDIVLADKPPISTETDRMDKGMLDQVSMSPSFSLCIAMLNHRRLYPASTPYWNSFKYLSQEPADLYSNRKSAISYG